MRGGPLSIVRCPLKDRCRVPGVCLCADGECAECSFQFVLCEWYVAHACAVSAYVFAYFIGQHCLELFYGVVVELFYVEVCYDDG